MEEKKNLLYLSANDGSDTRINKELASLKKRYQITYLGIGKDNNLEFIKKYTSKSHIITGSHKSIWVIIKFHLKLIFLLSKKKYDKVHVVDEQFYFLFIIILLNKNITLDIFDSFFLKKNFEGNKLYFLKRIIYGIPNRIIVTDEERFNLLPLFAQKKGVIIPNVPNFREYKGGKLKLQPTLTICYFGTLTDKRGTKFLCDILDSQSTIEIRVIAAGWIADEATRIFITRSNVEYLGIKSQSEVNQILYEKGDYLLSIYPYDNTNNIYASPNKIYDSIQCLTPLIINKEIRISNFVEYNNLGFTFDSSEDLDYKKIVEELFKKRGTYNFDQNLIKKYCWENYENILLNL